MLGLGKEFWVLVLSMTPVSELRGAIPYGMNAGLEPAKVVALSIFGNILIVPLLLKLLEPLMELLYGLKAFQKSIDWVKERTMRKTRDKVRKYSVLGLYLFVALPIPTTGVWTGCLAASLLKMDFKKSLLAISLGVLTSGLIVSVFSYHLILY